MTKMMRLLWGPVAALCLVTLFVLMTLGTPGVAHARAAGVSVDVTARVTGTLRGATTAGVGTPSYPFELLKLTQYSPGAGSGLVDLLYCGERTLAASGTENLDLAGGLTSPLGATLTFVKVKAIIVVASAANTNNVVLGGAASNTFTGPFADATDKISLKPGSAWLISDPLLGWAVTASTGDILLAANSSSGTGVTYKICIIGASA